MPEDFEELQQQVEDLVERLDRLTGHDSWMKLSSVTERLDELENRVGYHSVEEIAETMEELRRTVKEIGGDTSTTVVSTSQLDQRLRLIERRVRTSAGTKTADLDSWPASCRDLLHAIRTGDDRRPQLLHEYQRNAREFRIKEPVRLEELRQKHFKAGAAAAHGMARAHDEEAWRQSRTAWNAAVTALQELAPKLDEAGENAVRERKELEEAISAHNAAVPVVLEGERCRTALEVKVRTRLGEALRDDLLLPGWFERVLGPTAPSEDTELWLTTAVNVIIYRLQYKITDPVVALGPRPGGSGHQQTQFDRLRNSCASLRA